MKCGKELIVYWCMPFVLLANATTCISQALTSELNPAQQRALELLNGSDTISTSPLWPHIKPAYFFSNIRTNILCPGKINQGHNTNFCSYAALTHLLIKYEPDNYTRMILSLYFTGKANLYSKKILAPSKRVKEAAGLLNDNGELNILHADQLWFLTMADNFKGYLNLFDHKYEIGDENRFWAATNYSKFNRMLREFGGYQVHAIGSDLIRPWKNKENLFKYMVSMLDTGLVMMYINNKLMYPHKFVLFTLPSPTHFVVLYELYKIDDMIEIKYWDYGLKTEQLITMKRFKKMIYGVSSITKK
jgi:hypothetical protein